MGEKMNLKQKKFKQTATKVAIVITLTAIATGFLGCDKVKDTLGIVSQKDLKNLQNKIAVENTMTPNDIIQIGVMSNEKDSVYSIKDVVKALVNKTIEQDNTITRQGTIIDSLILVLNEKDGNTNKRVEKVEKNVRNLKKDVNDHETRLKVAEETITQYGINIEFLENADIQTQKKIIEIVSGIEKIGRENLIYQTVQKLREYNENRNKGFLGLGIGGDKKVKATVSNVENHFSDYIIYITMINSPENNPGPNDFAEYIIEIVCRK